MVGARCPLVPRHPAGIANDEGNDEGEDCNDNGFDKAKRTLVKAIDTYSAPWRPPLSALSGDVFRGMLMADDVDGPDETGIEDMARRGIAAAFGSAPRDPPLEDDALALALNDVLDASVVQTNLS